jgi:galactose mutarotase-like enzyme
MTMGGAIELPWAGRIWGTPTDDGHVTTLWRGHTIALWPGASGDAAKDGLMLAMPADSSQTAALPDGGDAEVVFHGGDFGAHWPSKTDVTVTVLLSSKAIDLTIEARNSGDAAEPIGIGWRPRFAILDGNRQQLRLRVPGTMRLDVRNRDQRQPTGSLLPVAGTPFDFAMDRGARLGTMDLDDSFVALHQNLLDNGPIAELSDPSNNYGLRLTALTPTIKAMHVVAPERGDFVSIEPQFNYEDPFGREWAKNTDTGMVVLQPKQSVQWKVRLEVFSITGTAAPM